MKRKDLKRAAREAIDLTSELKARLPAGRTIPSEDLFAVVWPLAVRLTKLRRPVARELPLQLAARAHSARRPAEPSGEQVTVALVHQQPVLRGHVPGAREVSAHSLASLVFGQVTSAHAVRLPSAPMPCPVRSVTEATMPSP
jgi:hypothetical protein